MKPLPWTWATGLVSALFARPVQSLAGWILGPSRRGFRSAALGLAAVVASTCAAAADDDPWQQQQGQLDRTLEREVRPLLADTCVGCHWGADAEAGLDLSASRGVEGMLDDVGHWRSALEMLRSRQMPPDGDAALAPEDRERLIEWLHHLVTTVACSRQSSPGAITIRRLNRVEYARTVRDLLGVDVDAAEWLPRDDVGYGFDNIGDVLTLSPVLVEQYLAAAEHIASTAIMDPRTMRLELELSGADFDTTGGSRVIDRDRHHLSTNGRIQYTLAVPQPGKYRVSIAAYGEHAGEGWVEMGLWVDGRQVAEDEVRSTRRRPSRHHFDIELPAGSPRLGVSFNNDYYRPDHEDPERRDRNLIVVGASIRGPESDDLDGYPDSHRRLVVERPARADEVPPAARRALEPLLLRAFRRPPQQHEVDRLASLVASVVDEGQPFEVGLQVALQAVLVSPHFLFKVERPLGDQSERTLDDWELATSLSYFLWASMPDDELLNLAAAGRLQHPQEFDRQVARMLDDPRAESLVDNFAVQWLQLRVLDEFQPDADLFPEFTDQLRQAMWAETRGLLSDVLLGNGSLVQLLEADYTYLNEALADLYAVPGIAGDRMQRVSLEGSPRGGLLTHASVLSLTSNPTRTSPVKRGKWVLDNLLNQPPPPPDPDAMELENQRQLTGTLRERMEQHRRDPSCASCHVRMDAIGFALENFDAIGRWRETDDGGAIDASGELPEGVRFEGAAQLQQVLVEHYRRPLVRAFTEKLLTYALGRGLQYEDACVVDDIVDRAAEDDYRFRSIVMGVVHSDPFRKRSAGRTPD